MPQFRYLAVNSAGARLPGTVQAASRAEALQSLAGRNLTPLSLSEQRSLQLRRQRISPSALAASFGLLSDQLETGVPLLRALQVLSQQSADPLLRNTLVAIAAEIADGSSLAAALAARPELFSQLDISMIQAGEEGGFLEESLRRLAAVRERQEEIRSRIISASAYPLLLAVVAALVVTGMLIFFVPQFEPLFASLREAGRLPWPTTVLLTLSDLLKTWSLPLALLLAAIAMTLRTRGLLTRLARPRDRLLMNLKAVGPVVRSVAIARFCRVLGSLLQNGVPMIRSLAIAGQATGNQILKETISAASDSICSGRNLSGPLAASGCFPPDVLEMLSVG
ncbi:MAG: type II secretion system F family protein, partial [Planctomyces sp.]